MLYKSDTKKVNTYNQFDSVQLIFIRFYAQIFSFTIQYSRRRHRRILGMTSARVGGAEAHFLPEFFRRQNVNLRHGIWISDTVRICSNDLI